MAENKEKKTFNQQGFPGKSIFFERLNQTIDNTGFFTLRFLHV